MILPDIIESLYIPKKSTIMLALSLQYKLYIPNFWGQSLIQRNPFYILALSLIIPQIQKKAAWNSQAAILNQFSF